MILWNANGAAIVQPVYFYFLTRSQARMRDPTIPVNNAVAILAMTLPIMSCPLLLFTPPWLEYSIWDHHGMIALFHVAPLLVTGLFLLVVVLLVPKYGVEAEKVKKDPHEDKPWTLACFLLAGSIATAAHVFTVLAALRTTDPDATLTRIFIPTLGRANPFPSWITTVDSTVKGVPEDYSALLEGFHLFSQFDWIVVGLSCILYCDLLLRESSGDGRERASEGSEGRWRNLGYLMLGTVLLGPGAAGSFALAINESRIRKVRPVEKAKAKR